jgi:hypothetical protein
MAGILDNKSRIFDTIVTQEGRRQMAEGDFVVEFVTFSDAGSFYQADPVNIADDAGNRLYFEACLLPQDQITFEADDSGFLQAFAGSDLGVQQGRILSGSSTKFLSVVTGAQFASLSTPLLTGSVENFKRLRSIGTVDEFSDSNRFIISTNKMEFVLTDEAPIPTNGIQRVQIEDVEGFFQDKRLAHLTNFQHLPPINRPTVDFPDGLPLGYYPRLGQQEIMTYEQLEADLIDRSWQTVEFRPTSRENNVVAQFFEAGSDALKKLDVIDFGSFLTKDEDRPEKRVFFVGKVFIDGTNVPTFVNLFTLVFE